jgi:hypothetical protein
VFEILVRAARSLTVSDTRTRSPKAIVQPLVARCRWQRGLTANLNVSTFAHPKQVSGWGFQSKGIADVETACARVSAVQILFLKAAEQPATAKTQKTQVVTAA